MTVLLLALLSGLLMSLIGVAYNLGRSRGLRPSHIATFIGFAGMVVFAALAGTARLRSAPGDVWIVPGGLPHAIGAGVLMVEVMEPSDWVVRCEFEREGERCTMGGS